MRPKIYILIITLFISFRGTSQTDDYRKFIQRADKVAKDYLGSFLGEKVVEKSIRLNESKSRVSNFKKNEYSMLIDYRNNYRPDDINLFYDFIYHKDTVYQMQIAIDDSFKIYGADSYLDNDLNILIGWKNVLQDAFKFNYDKLKTFIKSDASIDTAYKDISIGYKTIPNVILKDNKNFIETKFYWVITISSRTLNPNGLSYDFRIKRELNIDANTGEIIRDKPMNDPFTY